MLKVVVPVTVCLIGVLLFSLFNGITFSKSALSSLNDVTILVLLE